MVKMARIRTFLCAVLAAHLFAQQTVIRTTVRLVQVPVSVTDKKGQFVYGLTANDFVLLDEGRERPVHVDDPDIVTAPLAVVVLIQTSDISDSALLKIQKVGSMVSEAVVGANGMTSVITYSDEVTVLLPFTRDSDAVSSALRNLKSEPTRNGHMLDAIGKALEMLQARPKGTRSAIILIGESKDRGSQAKLTDLLPSLQQSAATVYFLEYSAFLTPFTTTSSEYSPPEGGCGWILDGITEAVHATARDSAELLTGSTGGRVLRFETKSKLENDLIHHRIRDPQPVYGLFRAPTVRKRELSSNHHRDKEPARSPRPEPGYWTKIR